MERAAELSSRLTGCIAGGNCQAERRARLDVHRAVAYNSVLFRACFKVDGPTLAGMVELAT